MCLNQSQFNNSSNFVAVTVDPALPARIKLQKLSKNILGSGSWISDWILKIVRSRIGRGIRRSGIEFSKPAIVVSCGRIGLKRGTSLECVTRSRANREKRQMNVVNSNQFSNLDNLRWINNTGT